MWSQPKFDLHVLEESICQIVREYAPAALQRGREGVFASDPMQCKTTVISFRAKSGKPFLVLTYGRSERRGTQYNTNSDEKTIWNVKSTPLGPNDRPKQDYQRIASLPSIVEVAKATIAASTRFMPFRVRAGPQVYVDGGLAANNPSSLIYNELKRLRGKVMEVEKESDPKHETLEPSGTFVKTFVSIGVSKEQIPLTGANRDSTRSILRRNSDLRRKV